MARRHVARAAALLAAALLMSGCPSSSLSVPDAKPSVTPGGTPAEVVLGSDCENEAEVVTPPFPEPHSRSMGSAGDRAYEALILTDEEEDFPCAAFLVFGWEGSYSSTGVTAEITPGFGFPRILSAPDVDGDGTPEVFVLVATGASTQFGLLYTLVDGVIREVSYEGGTGPGNLIAYGGSVGHIDGAWCGPGGSVVLSSAVPEGDHYLLERRFFELDGATLKEDRVETLRVSSEELGGLPDLVGQPFDRCPA